MCVGLYVGGIQSVAVGVLRVGGWYANVYIPDVLI